MLHCRPQPRGDWAGWGLEPRLPAGASPRRASTLTAQTQVFDDTPLVKGPNGSFYSGGNRGIELGDRGQDKTQVELQALGRLFPLDSPVVLKPLLLIFLPTKDTVRCDGEAATTRR